MCAQTQTQTKRPAEAAPAPAGDPVPAAVLPEAIIALNSLKELKSQTEALREEMREFYERGNVNPKDGPRLLTRQKMDSLDRPMKEIDAILGELKNADLATYRRAQAKFSILFEQLQSVELDYSAFRLSREPGEDGKRLRINRSDLEKMLKDGDFKPKISVKALDVINEVAKLPKVQAALKQEERQAIVGFLPDQILQSFGQRGTHSDGFPIWEVKAGQATVFFKYSGKTKGIEYVEIPPVLDPKNPPKTHRADQPVSLSNPDWVAEAKYIQEICDRIVHVPTMTLEEAKKESEAVNARFQARSGTKGEVQLLLLQLARAGLTHTEKEGYLYRVKGGTHSFDLFQGADGKTQWRQSSPKATDFQLASVKPTGDHQELKDFRALLEQILLVEAGETPAKFVAAFGDRPARVKESTARGRTLLLSIAGGTETKNEDGTPLYSLKVNAVEIFFRQRPDGVWEWGEDKTKAFTPLEPGNRYKGGSAGIPPRHYQSANAVAAILHDLNRAVDPAKPADK